MTDSTGTVGVHGAGVEILDMTQAGPLVDCSTPSGSSSVHCTFVGSQSAES